MFARPRPREPLHHRFMNGFLTIFVSAVSLTPFSTLAVCFREIRLVKGAVPPLAWVAAPIAFVLALLLFIVLRGRIRRVWATAEGLIASPPGRCFPWREVRALKPLSAGVLGGLWYVELADGTKLDFIAHAFASDRFEYYRARAVAPKDDDIPEREALHGGGMLLIAWGVALIGGFALVSVPVPLWAALRDRAWAAVAALVLIGLVAACFIRAVFRLPRIFMTRAGLVVGNDVIPWDRVAEIRPWFLSSDGPHTIVTHDGQSIRFFGPGDAKARFERCLRAIRARAPT